MEPFSVESWLSSKDEDIWTNMMQRVAAFHHKHDFAGNNGHDMGYRIALTVEELGELATPLPIIVVWTLVTVWMLSAGLRRDG